MCLSGTPHQSWAGCDPCEEFRTQSYGYRQDIDCPTVLWLQSVFRGRSVHPNHQIPTQAREGGCNAPGSEFVLPISINYRDLQFLRVIGLCFVYQRTENTHSFAAAIGNLS